MLSFENKSMKRYLIQFQFLKRFTFRTDDFFQEKINALFLDVFFKTFTLIQPIQAIKRTPGDIKWKFCKYVK